MEKEIWKPIEEFPIYYVSNLGNVKNINTQNIILGSLDRDGYRQITICYKNKQYCRRVCRLVAKAFVENPNNYPIVNHKNEIKTEDKSDNLEWCTIAYNNTYGTRLDKIRKKVMCVETGEIYLGVRDAARHTGISHSRISNSCTKGIEVCGYHWKFIQ